MNSTENEELNLYDMYLVLKKRYKLIAGILVVSLFLIGIITYFERPIYRSSFTIKVPTFVDIEKNSERAFAISNFEIKKLTDELNFILKNEKHAKMLSEKFGIEEEKARALSNLIVNLRGDSNEFVEISMDVHEPQPVNDLKRGILHILTKHMSKKTTSLRKKNLLEKKEFDVKIKEMEEIRDIVFAQIKSEGPKYIGFNPLQLERDLLNFKKRLIDIENEIRSLSEFEIVAESMMPQKMRPRISVNFALAVITSLIVSIFLSFILEWLEKNAKKVRHASGKEHNKNSNSL